MAVGVRGGVDGEIGLSPGHIVAAGLGRGGILVFRDSHGGTVTSGRRPYTGEASRDREFDKHAITLPCTLIQIE